MTHRYLNIPLLWCNGHQTAIAEQEPNGLLFVSVPFTPTK
ncbi:hypothetical protein N644_2796 [Lactiplantibacillus paraplantarum]|nr:hypothetical protein N644_2796 [Lactiplantibacillus paraplantarum]